MRVFPVVIFLGIAEAAPYTTRRGSCSGRGRIPSEKECRHAMKRLGLKTVEKYESWVESREFPGGFSVAGKGTEPEDDTIFPYCSYVDEKDKEHFSWCDDNGKCEFSSLHRENKAVCRAYCSEIMRDSQCNSGEVVSKKRSGSTKSECCVKDESAKKVEVSEALVSCVRKEKVCQEHTPDASRLYADDITDDIPRMEAPSAVMPVFAASAAFFAAGVAVGSYRRRQPSGGMEQPLPE